MGYHYQLQLQTLKGGITVSLLTLYRWDSNLITLADLTGGIIVYTADLLQVGYLILIAFTDPKGGILVKIADPDKGGILNSNHNCRPKKVGSTMANRVKFDFKNNIKRRETELLEIVIDICLDLTPTDCNVGQGGGVVTFYKEDTLNQLFTQETMERFKEVHIEPIPPRQFFTERTIFVTNVKPHVAQMLLQDFNNSNGNIQAEEVKDVTPSNSSKTTLKIILQQKEHVDNAMTKGIRLRLVWIEKINITKQKDDEIRQCFKCFKFEHYNNQCARLSPICSICSGEHHFKNCPNPTMKKCVNCSGDHIAIARGCPTHRKELAQLINNTIPPHPVQPTAQANTPPNIHSTEAFPPLRNPTTTNNNNIHTNNAPASDNSTT